MSLLGFKEWLSKQSPEGGGEIWNNGSNADLAFGKKGAKSKHTSMDRPEKSALDPEKLFLGVPKKQIEKLDRLKDTIIGGNYAPDHYV